MIRTEIGYSTVEAITVRGLDLATEIIGKFDFVDMIFHTTLARFPSAQEKIMINALLVSTADHGITPSAIAARLTYTGAPEAMQGAIAAGLLGAGSTLLGSMQDVAQMLLDATRDLPPDASDAQLDEVARNLIQTRKSQRKPIPGFGHGQHIHGDPRVPTLRELSRANGFYGVHWRLLDRIFEAIKADKKRTPPINATGAIGAIIAAMGLSPIFARGLAVVGRSAGLLAHICEESENPIGRSMSRVIREQDPRNVHP